MGEDGGENSNCGGIKERVVRQRSMEGVGAKGGKERFDEALCAEVEQDSEMTGGGLELDRR